MSTTLPTRLHDGLTAYTAQELDPSVVLRNLEAALLRFRKIALSLQPG